MQKKFKIEVDCANCAAKMENGIKNIDGVRSATVSGAWPVSSSRAAPAAPSAAQVPVV